MIEFYSLIRTAHVAAVLASGALFLLRGLMVSAGRREWALTPLLRYLSYTIDTALLAAAVMLVCILPSTVYGNGWLAAKLAILPVYVVLGWLALRRAEPARRQLAYLAAALFAYGSMFAIARAHDPLGPLRGILGS
jgi:uncharacterized membrane protein SirB2